MLPLFIIVVICYIQLFVSNVFISIPGLSSNVCKNKTKVNSWRRKPSNFILYAFIPVPIYANPFPSSTQIQVQRYASNCASTRLPVAPNQLPLTCGGGDSIYIAKIKNKWGL
jgi:hypothetical protein